MGGAPAADGRSSCGAGGAASAGSGHASAGSGDAAATTVSGEVAAEGSRSASASQEAVPATGRGEQDEEHSAFAAGQSYGGHSCGSQAGENHSTSPQAVQLDAGERSRAHAFMHATAAADATLGAMANAEGLLMSAIEWLGASRRREHAMTSAQWSWTYARGGALHGARASGAQSASGGLVATLLGCETRRRRRSRLAEARVEARRKRRRLAYAKPVESSDRANGGPGSNCQRHESHGGEEEEEEEEEMAVEAALRALLRRIGAEMVEVCSRLTGAKRVGGESLGPGGGIAYALECRLVRLAQRGARRSRSSSSVSSCSRVSPWLKLDGSGGSMTTGGGETTSALVAKFELWRLLGRALARHCAALSEV